MSPPFPPRHFVVLLKSNWPAIRKEETANIAVVARAKSVVTVLPLGVVFLLVVVLALSSCNRQSESNSPTTSNVPEPSTQADATRGKAFFREIQEETGLDFLHQHGGAGEKHYIETMGSGGGFLDFDNDGWLDIYLVQSGPLPGSGERASASNRLFRNQGVSGGSEQVRAFLDVTEQSGAGDTGYGMGCSFGDYDNDGNIDIFVTNFGPNQLYRNNGDGTFTDVTEQAGVGDERWGVSAAFADYDQDGDLDLYVVNYLTYSMDKNIRCGSKEIRMYCHPDVYPGSPDILYVNNGDGTFSDVTEEAGAYIGSPDEAKGLGVAWCDYDNDGDQDIYIANDSTPNFLFRNNNDGTFTDVAMEAGTAFNGDGETEAGMGIGLGDYDRDGNYDIFVTHLDGETNTLYANQGGGFFEDYTVRANLGIASIPKVGFGTNFFDYDNDGWLDIFIANGHILEAIERYTPETNAPYAQSNQLYVNNGNGSFTEISEKAGLHFQRRRVSRGAAFGDIDNDGDLDILVTNNNQQAVLLLNLVGQENKWIGFELQGENRDSNAIGARVEIKLGDRIRSQEVRSGSSYLSQHDLRIVFGFGKRERPAAAWIRWPEGERQEIDLKSLQINAYNTERERKDGKIR